MTKTKTTTINSKSLVGFIDEIEIAKRAGWKVYDVRAEYFAELIKTNEPRLLFTIGPVSNRMIKKG